MGESNGALTKAFENHHMELAALRQINGRIEAIRGKARASPNP
jgi:hypothetical protein